MSKSLINGLHHVTALASSPQQNVNFYAGILGLRLVKKTINFDAPQVYHLYYGDESGLPGSIMTFFPFQGLQKGRHGIGQAATTTFSIPMNSVDYWLKRFDQFHINYKHPLERVKQSTKVFKDLGAQVIEKIYPNMGHTIIDDEIEEANRILKP